MRAGIGARQSGSSSQSVQPSGTRRPDHSHTPAIERLVPNQVVQDSVAFQLDPWLDDPAGGHEHDHQEAPYNSIYDNLSKRWTREHDSCTAGRADVIHPRSLSLPGSG